MTSLGWLGVWLLVAAVLLLVVEGVLAAVWGMAVARRALVLAELVETGRGAINADMARLRLAIGETRRLWRPYARALRWLRHPLTIALLESFARRRAATR